MTFLLTSLCCMCPQIVSRNPLPSKNLSKRRKQKTATGNPLLKVLKSKTCFQVCKNKDRISLKSVVFFYFLFFLVKILSPILVSYATTSKIWFYSSEKCKCYPSALQSIALFVLSNTTNALSLKGGCLFA